MDKISEKRTNITRRENIHYDAWLQWNVTTGCNLDCEYCFGHEQRVTGIYSIDIKSALDSLTKTGKIFRIGFTGGEPFLVPNFSEACHHFSKEHFISINSNLVNNKLPEFINMVSPERIIFIHASFHYKTLAENRLLDKFLKNFHLLKSEGFNVEAVAVGWPGYSDIFSEIKNLANKNRLDLRFDPFFGSYKDKIYPESYTEEEISLFSLDREYIKAYLNTDLICNAGYNVAVISPGGTVRSCFQMDGKLGNIYEGFDFNKHGKSCHVKKCGCPLWRLDKTLFARFANR